MQRAVRYEPAFNQLQHFTPQHAAFAVCPFPPRVGKVNMYGGKSIVGDHIPKDKSGISANDDGVCPVLPNQSGCGKPGIFDADFYAEKIMLRRLPRGFIEEHSFAGTDLEFQRGDAPKKFFGIPRLRQIIRHFENRRKISVGINGFNASACHSVYSPVRY
jgi:hypothetical protein